MQYVLIPLAVMCAAQALKLIIEGLRGEFAWSHVNSYGGMPSSHAALVSSLATVIGYGRGFLSVEFALALVIFIIVARDAMGFRFQLSVHGKILNKLIKELPDRVEYRYPILSERLGHTPVEVAAGVSIGIFGTLLLLVLFPL